ncbi:MAG: phosphoglycerate kinase [Prevotella sp.]|nr:phosphoglycerate kinase [Prevotella sp.]
MHSIRNISFRGRKVLLRVDFNVPIDENNNITDDTRIRMSLPTINKLIADGASVIIISHFGRPKGVVDPNFSLINVAKRLEELVGHPVKFTTELLGPTVIQMAKDLKPGEIFLLENIRFYPGETQGDVKLAEDLAKLGDTYVNDAFGAAHRNHSTTAVIDHFFPQSRYYGLLMEQEVENLTKLMDNPQRPFTAIIGGSKISSKIEVMENLINKVDNMIIIGGMRYTFTKAMGGKIGNSIHEDDKLETALDLIHKMEERGVKYYLPIDCYVADAFSNDANRMLVPGDQIPDGWEAMDCGPESCKLFHDVIMSSKTILWNGPAGVFEFPNFAMGTHSIARSVAEASRGGAFAAIGGGDSIAAVQQLNLVDAMDYVSTGGGAMLAFLEGKNLPGLKAFEE